MKSSNKIVVTQNMDFYPDQIERLNSLGDRILYIDRAASPEEWLNRCKDSDIICSGLYGLKEKVYELPNKFYSLPFVGAGWLDKERLKENNITVSYSPGCNKAAVSEWITAMMLNLLRELPRYTNIENLPKGTLPEMTLGANGKNVCILGSGNIGTQVGKICSALDMNVYFFDRNKNLIDSVSCADVIINTLSLNPGTDGLLDAHFFNSLKKGSYFISVTEDNVYDTSALFEALDNNVLEGAAIDTGSSRVGDIDDPLYKQLIRHPKILATPHIAYNTDVTARISNDIMIDNIDAWLKGEPINLLE